MIFRLILFIFCLFFMSSAFGGASTCSLNMNKDIHEKN
jgi:hypothetical protein